MTVQFDVPQRVEEILRKLGGGASAAAKEAAMIELFRRGSLTHHELGETLGITRLETDAILKQHNLTEDLLTPDELASDIAALRRLVP